MLNITLAACALIIAAVLTIYHLLTPPASFPKNIPTIPFYYTLLPFFWDVDQAELYRKYLKTKLDRYGAVKIFFGSRWNILVTRPSFVAHVFKDEDVFQKSGNQKKIPYAVVAEYTGENIISAHGENWRLYRSVIQPGLQRDFPTGKILANAELLHALLVENQAQGNTVSIPFILQRYTLANLSQIILGSDFRTMELERAPLHEMQIRVKRMIFNPIFLNFPFLDKFSFIKSRIEARRLVNQFADHLMRTVKESHVKGCAMHDDNVGCRLIAAKEDGRLSDKQFRDNLISVFLAGHENPQLLLVSMMYLLGKHPNVQEQVRQEIISTGLDVPTNEALKELPIMTSVIYETLRMFPPISQLINRCTSEDIVLGGTVPIPAGTYLGYNAYATGRDEQGWGPDADEFNPGRWGNSVQEIAETYRRHASRAAFIAFHGGRRACLGQRFAMFETRATMFYLMKRLRWMVDPTWHERMTPAGPLYARDLKLIFQPTEAYDSSS